METAKSALQFLWLSAVQATFPLAWSGYPGHNWAEFCLHDEKGQWHWIPAHTSYYDWFGWTGVHEVVRQKGDRVYVPEKRQPQRLLADWLQWYGHKPDVRYLAEVAPSPTENEEDAGPGARSKDEIGKWLTVGPHADAEYTRQT